MAMFYDEGGMMCGQFQVAQNRLEQRKEQRKVARNHYRKIGQAQQQTNDVSNIYDMNHAIATYALRIVRSIVFSDKAHPRKSLPEVHRRDRISGNRLLLSCTSMTSVKNRSAMLVPGWTRSSSIAI